MGLDVLRNFFLWCTVINYLVLIVWALLILLPHQWMYRLWSKWFHLPVEQINAINFAGLAVYKLGIILFNLVPYIALQIVG